RLDHRRNARSARHQPAPGEDAGRWRRGDRLRDGAQAPPRGRLPAHRRGTGMTAAVAIARRPERATLVRAVCVREWREALGNKLLVGMTLLPPVVILAAGIIAVAAAAVNPPSERDVLVTWIAYAIYLVSVSSLGSRAAVNAVTAPRWILAIVVMVPLLTLLSVNLGILISTRVNDVRVAQQIGGLVVIPVVGVGIAQV